MRIPVTLLSFSVALLVLFLGPTPSHGALTMEQMAESAAMMRQACQPKTKASDTDIDNIRENKIFAENKEIKCFVNCVFEMMQMFRKGKLQKDAGARAMQAMMPDELLEEQLVALDICEKSSAGIADKCEAAYAHLQCNSKNVKTFVFT